MKHIVMFSGGVGSYLTAKRVLKDNPKQEVVLLFADTLMEDEDLYRFLRDAEKKLGIEVTTIADGRDPWELFKDEKFIGNSQTDICSKVLKRKLMDNWLKSHFEPDECIIYIGIDWTEVHRYDRLKERKLPYVYKAPLCDPPYYENKDAMLQEVENDGIKIPRLYELGFPHNNCGGFCIKAGHAHFKLLLEKMPERYLYHEQREQELREFIGKDVAIMRERGKGPRREAIGVHPEDPSRDDEIPRAVPLTMREFRERIEQEETDQLDLLDFGGCGCAID